MLKLRKFFRLPGPKELGWSDHDALGSRHFTPFQEGKTWEDWEEHVRKEYPVRFFLSETLPNFFRPVGWKAGRVWYWIKCHVLPSHRFHLLDFRGVDPLHEYTHGYMDPCTVVWLAAWAALRSYVEKEEPTDPASWASPEELAEEPLKDQKARYDEAIELHRWWMKGRAAEEAEESRLHKAVDDARTTHDREAYDEASRPWLEYHRWREDHDEEMFLRLCKLRRSLWT